MSTVSTLQQHLADANPRLYLAETAPTEAIPELACGIHPSAQIMPAPEETEIGRYFFSGGIGSAVSPLSGHPMRLLAAADAARAQLIPLISGAGLVVVTDRRLLGQINGLSRLSDRIDLGDEGALFFSMGYEDVDSVVISQERSIFGGLKERRVNMHGLEIGGFLGVEVTATVSLRGDDVTSSKLRTGRPFFDQVVQAAATYRSSLDVTTAEHQQLQRVLAGDYVVENGELTANLTVDSAVSGSPN